FYRTGDNQDLADKLLGLLQSPERQKLMAKHNFSAALRMTMPRVIHDYVRHFGVEQQTRALRPIRWFRKLPLWMSRSFVGKAVLRSLLSRSHRRFPYTESNAFNTAGLFNANVQGGRYPGIGRGPHNGNVVAGTRLNLTRAHSARAAEKNSTNQSQNR